MDSEKILEIKNFRLNILKNLLEQSLICSNKFMLEISKDLIKSCSVSTTESLLKLWIIPLKKLIIIPDNSGEIIFDLNDEEPSKIEDFPNFNLYILKGDLFRKFISVYNMEMVDLKFNLRKINDTYYATHLVITGKSENDSPLVTTYTLTTEEFLSNKIGDYNEIISQCTPSKEFNQFILTSQQIQEVKRLIKNLHKSNPQNYQYLNFTVDVDTKQITVNDKVFNISFKLSEEILSKIKFAKSSYSFKILKSDFIIIGNHNLMFYTDEISEKLIINTNYSDSIISCLVTKISENSNLDLNSDNLDMAIDNIDISEYL